MAARLLVAYRRWDTRSSGQFARTRHAELSSPLNRCYPSFSHGGGSSRRRDDSLGIDPRLGRRKLPSAIERCRLCDFLVTRRTYSYVLSDRPRFATLAVFLLVTESREDERETAIRNAGNLDQVARLSLFAEFALSIDYGCATGGLRLCPGRSLQRSSRWVSC